MKYHSLRTKLVICFVAIVALAGAVATLIGIHLINRGVVRQAQEKVALDLNTARLIYQQKLKDVETILSFTCIRDVVRTASVQKNWQLLGARLKEVREKNRLDVLNATDSEGRVVLRTRNPSVLGDSQAQDPIVSIALQTRRAVSCTAIIPREELLKEGEDLAAQAKIGFIPTQKAKPRPEKEETDGMMLKAAVPCLKEDGSLLGVLYGGKLINRNYEIVDTVKETVYRGLKYKDQDIGTATIFQGDLRISTNVNNLDGTRAVGTRLSEEVADHVLGKGGTWEARAFVVNNWYLSAYEPIRDIKGQPIGVLYVGVLEQKYSDMKREAILFFFGITSLGIGIALVVACLLAFTITKPVRALRSAASGIAAGNFDVCVPATTRDEIGDLALSFNKMTQDLKRVQEEMIVSQKLAVVGTLSAAVAHELNSPITSILTLLEMLSRDTPQQSQLRRDLEFLANEVRRCAEVVKNLLEFTRRSSPRKGRANIARITEETVKVLNHQAYLRNVQIKVDIESGLPEIIADADQMKQVLLNLVLNGIQAIEQEGKVTICAKRKDQKHVLIQVIDTGAGIPEEMHKFIFQPFFTTKEPGVGTGLGLVMCRDIVVAHGGKISLESTVSVGTTVSIELPTT